MPWLGQAGRLDETRAVRSRPGLSWAETPGGRVRLRRQPCAAGPRLLFAADGPNVLEHYDALLGSLEGVADVVVFEPPGTGASVPARGFDFSLEAFAQVAAAVLRDVGPRVVIFPCYLGFTGQVVARRHPDLVRALVMPQAASWGDFQTWAERVDRRRVLRTPVVGQLLMAARRRQVARSWYRASCGHERFRAPFGSAADEAFAFGGCFCLASLMQGHALGPVPEVGVLPVRSVVVAGPRDRSHRGTDFSRAQPGAELVRFEACGHSPELEDPVGFSRWLLQWEAR